MTFSHHARDNDDVDLPAPKSTLLSSSTPISSLEATLLKSSSESMGLSDSVWGVAGSAASTCSESLCLVLLAFLAGIVSCEAVVEVIVLSSFRLRVVEGVVLTPVAASLENEAAWLSKVVQRVCRAWPERSEYGSE